MFFSLNIRIAGSRLMLLMLIVALCSVASTASAQITTIRGTDRVSDSRITINNNFTWLDANKAAPGACPAGRVAIQTTTTGVVCIPVSYLSLTDIPTAFTPGAHQHDASEVITGVLPLARGGTGQGAWIGARCVQVSADGSKLESATGPCGLGSGGGMADPTTTRGDLIYHGAAGTTRLALGAASYVLISNGTDAAWAQYDYANLLNRPTLGNSAALNTGTTAGTVATGNHAHAGVYEPVNANIQAHIARTDNPHQVTVEQVGAEPADPRIVKTDTNGNLSIGSTVLCASIGTNTGTTYTLSGANNGCILRFTAATDVILTVPSGLPDGFSVLIIQRGEGAVIPTAGAGVVLANRQNLTKTAGAKAIATLACDVADDCILSGDLQ